MRLGSQAWALVVIRLISLLRIELFVGVVCECRRRGVIKSWMMVVRVRGEQILERSRHVDSERHF